MLLEILKRTPAWVFVLFAALAFFGVMQSRARQITMTRVTILPVVLIGLSLSGLWGTFGGNGMGAYAIAAWLATGVSFAYGLMSGAFLARALRILASARAAELPS